MTKRGSPAELDRLGHWRLAICVLLFAGCSERPKAPALVQGLAEFHDEREGLRFAPPEGWLQQERGNFPSSRHDKERVIVKYRSLGEGKAGVFRVSMIDLPDSESTVAYLSSRPEGPERWKMTSGVEAVRVDGQPAERVTYNGFWEGRRIEQPMTKEVVAVRRGQRVYFLTGIFASGDKQIREVTRNTLASLAWDPKQ